MAKKKALTLDLRTRRSLIDDHDQLSLRRQCELLGLHRSGLYYEPVGASDEEELLLRKEIDEVYTAWPFYGSRRIAIEVNQRMGFVVNRKRIQRLMRSMGIQAVGPRLSLSRSNPGHKVYPYLLRGHKVSRPDEVWSTDITYVRLARGFAYLSAVIDWFSRYVLSWKLSNTMDADLCLGVLDDALATGGQPEIFNTDQGSQYTSDAFVAAVLKSGARISMDGRGRALDNVFVERLWRSVKYENIYLQGYETMTQAEAGLEAYFDFYNGRRPHQSLGYKPPREVYGT